MAARPAMTATARSSTPPADDPLGLNDELSLADELGGGGDPLGSSAPYDDLFGSAPVETSGHTLAATNTAAVAAPAKTGRRRRKQGLFGWYSEVLRKSFDFSGRATRKEYWLFVLGQTLLIFLWLPFLMVIPPIGMLAALYFMYSIIPGLSVTVRRLHDTGRSGWHILIGYIPLIGIILLLWMLEDSEYRTNEYGPCPKGGY